MPGFGESLAVAGVPTPFPLQNLDGTPLTGTIAESCPRWASGGTIAFLASGEGLFAVVHLFAGQVIGHLAWCVGTTGATTPTNQWLGLFDSTGHMVAQTADQLTAAQTASTLYSIAIAQIASGASATYTVPTTGDYYIGIFTTATGLPNAAGMAGPPNNGLITANNGVLGLSLGGTEGTVRTTPPAFPTQVTIGASQRFPWVAALS
jgi:hypothetical protein